MQITTNDAGLLPLVESLATDDVQSKEAVEQALRKKGATQFAVMTESDGSLRVVKVLLG